MNVSIAEKCNQYQLCTFHTDDAEAIARWVSTHKQMCWLAPSTKLPLTADKILNWKKPGGQAFVYKQSTVSHPIGYGELNPMRRYLDQLWLGHVIIRPDQRGTGSGRLLVQALLKEAFQERLATRVLLIVFPDNTPAVQCYLSVGFKITGEEFHQFCSEGPEHRLLRLEMTSDRFEECLNEFF